MPDALQQTGWQRNDEAREAFSTTLKGAYADDSFSGAAPALKGHWNRLVKSGTTRVLAQDFELQILGEHLPPDEQARGTCVSRGSYKAAQDSYFYELAQKLIVGRIAKLCFEPLYGGARVNIGKGWLGRSHRGDCRCGRCPNEGAAGSHAAEYLWRWGLLERGKYGRFDLSRPNESLACDWGNDGVPQEILMAGAEHPCLCHRVYNTDELADCCAAGYFAAYCSPYLWGDRDLDGMSRIAQAGAHCEEVSGVFLLPSGQTAFTKQQSWGQFMPRGQQMLRTKGGLVKLRPGAYGAFAGDLQRGLDNGGEAWCFKVKTPFRGPMKELVT